MTARHTSHLQLVVSGGQVLPGTCHSIAGRYRLVEALALVPVERIALDMLRHLCASFSSGSITGWDKAHDLAEKAFGINDGTAFVAHFTALLRAVREERALPFSFMAMDCPACSLRITAEELLCIRLIRAARDNDPKRVHEMAASLAGKREAPQIAGAAIVLGHQLPAFAVQAELHAPSQHPPARPISDGKAAVFPFLGQDRERPC